MRFGWLFAFLFVSSGLFGAHRPQPKIPYRDVLVFAEALLDGAVRAEYERLATCGDTLIDFKVEHSPNGEGAVYTVTVGEGDNVTGVLQIAATPEGDRMRYNADLRSSGAEPEFKFTHVIMLERKIQEPRRQEALDALRELGIILRGDSKAIRFLAVGFPDAMKKAKDVPGVYIVERIKHYHTQELQQAGRRPPSKGELAAAVEEHVQTAPAQLKSLANAMPGQSAGTVRVLLEIRHAQYESSVRAALEAMGAPILNYIKIGQVFLVELTPGQAQEIVDIANSADPGNFAGVFTLRPSQRVTRRQRG